MLDAERAAPQTHHAGESWQTESGSTASAPFLYGLSLAVGLPAATWRPPPHPAVPTVHWTPAPILDPAELQLLLGRSVGEVGRGWVALRDVDWRLDGLALTLDVLRAGTGRGVLVTVGVVGLDRETLGFGGARPADLWALAREAIPRYGLTWRCQLGAAFDSIAVLYGRATSQVAWLADDHLATVSVTDLEGDEKRPTDLAQALARLLTSRLAHRMG